MFIMIAIVLNIAVALQPYPRLRGACTFLIWITPEKSLERLSQVVWSIFNLSSFQN